MKLLSKCSILSMCYILLYIFNFSFAQTWVRVDDAPGISGHPAGYPKMIMNDNLIFYSVWADDRNNNSNCEIYFAASTDTANTWTTPNIDLSQSSDTNDLYPWLCVDSTNLYVVWQSWINNTWKIYFTKSSDTGVTWTAPDTVPDILVMNNYMSSLNFGPQPKIAIDSKSNIDSTFLYLLWADNATGLIQIKLARSTDFGQSFADLGIIDNNLGHVNRNPYIVVDDSGTVHCAWAWGISANNMDPHPWIGYNRSQDRGNTFLANDIIVNDDLTGVYRGNPSLTFDASDNNMLICWEDSRRAGGNGNPDIWFSTIHRDSLSATVNKRVNWWGPDTTIAYDNFKPAIGIDPQDRIVAAWHDDPENDAEYSIHFAAYNDTIGEFSNCYSLINTFTGMTGASFGKALCQPSFFNITINSITNFIMVWQDFVEDSLGGNIYSVIDDYGRIEETVTGQSVNLNLCVFPNPAHKDFNIQYTLPQHTKVSLSIYDVAGRLVNTLANTQHEPGSYQQTFNTANLSQGVYFVRLRTSDKSIVEKAIFLK